MRRDVASGWEVLCVVVFSQFSPDISLQLVVEWSQLVKQVGDVNLKCGLLVPGTVILAHVAVFTYKTSTAAIQIS